MLIPQCWFGLKTSGMKMTDLNIWEKAMGWRKRQMVEAQVDNEITRKIRNDAIEEVAKEIEKMTVFGKDTIGSFTVVIRNLKTKE